MFVTKPFVKAHFETTIAKPFVQRSVARSRLYLYFYVYSSWGGERGGGGGCWWWLIDSLIGAVHFDDLVLEKDVADVDHFVIIMQSIKIMQSLKKLE